MLTLMIYTRELNIYYFVLLLLFFLHTTSVQCADSKTADEMNLFRYSAKRLSKKMSPSVSAVLMECPKTSATPSCQRKILVNIRVSPNDQTNRKEKYLLLDEVFDQRKQTRAKLMSPYLIELSQGEPVLMYPLEFVKNVDCNSCENKARKTEEDNTEAQQTKPEIKTGKQNDRNADRTGTKADLFKNLQTLSKHLPKSSFKPQHSPSYYAGGPSAEDDEKDTNINIDIALNDDNFNINDMNDNIQAQRSAINPNSERNVKRNPKNTDELLFGSFDDGESSRNYDEVFDELERENEKIKKDILEILRPALKITDADLKATEAPRTDDSTKEPINQTTSTPAPSLTSASNSCSPTASDPKCPPCPLCPAYRTSGRSSTPKLKHESEGKACQECSSYRAKTTLNRPQLNVLTLPQTQSENKPQEEAILSTRMRPILYGSRKGGHTFRPDSLQELIKDDLPIQEVSEDSSSNSDDAELPGDYELSSNPNEINEESEDVFSSVDEVNDDLVLSNNRQNNVKFDNSKNKSKLKQSRYPFRAPTAFNNENGLEGDLTWGSPLGDPSEVSKFKKYHLDPTSYSGVGANQVDRYHSLLGSNAFRGSPNKYTNSKFRKNQKKEAGFISYANGYGLNVDAPDLLNSSFIQPGYAHEPPMPRLHHYYMHLEAPPCTKCEENPASLSSAINFKQTHPIPKKDMKKSIPRMCPFGKSCPFLRKISTSKLNPVRKIKYDSDLQENDPREHGNILNYARASKFTKSDDKEGTAQDFSSELGNNQRGGAEVRWKPIQHGAYKQKSEQLGEINRLNGNGPDNVKINYEQEDKGRKDEYSYLPANINSKMNAVIYKGDNRASNLVTGQLTQNSVRHNSQDQVEDDGDEYEDYEEDSSDFSNFPNVVVSQSRPKFPSVYQHPVYAPHVSLESDDGSLSSFEGEMDDSPDIQQQQKKAVQLGINQHREDMNAYIDETRSDNPSPAQVLLSQVDQNMLPDKAPYDDFMIDPHLNTNDKMRIIELVDPHDVSIESLLKYLDNEVQNSYSPYYITKHDRGQRHPGNFDPDTSTQSRGHGKYIEKRSYVLYDDLEMRDTDVDDQVRTPARHVPAFDSARVARKPHLRGTSLKSVDNEKDAKKSVRSIEDIWYSVFNMSVPLQFLTTRVRIFRKKENSWWKIAPSITLTSLSGIYANANLSVLFSSHVEIYNLDKPASLNNYKILIPKNHTNATAKEMFAIDKHKFNLDNTDFDESALASICEAASGKIDENTAEAASVHKRNNEDDKVHSLQDLGDFPSRMNILEQCKNDPNHLCLNVLDEETPGYHIKIEIPFHDNSLVYKDYFKARITSITADATINEAVQIVVTFINEALMTHDLDIIIADCPVTCGEKNVVHKISPPHRGLTVAFLLPVAEHDSGVKHQCEVQIRTVSNQIISRRRVIVQPRARCLCIWQCYCHCFQDIVSTSISDMCHQMSLSDETNAGFLNDDDPSWTWQAVSIWFAIFLLLLLLLGCMKAWLGCCVAFVGHWKYDYLQPMKKYDEASRCRRFCINIIFFLCFPFVCLCHCFHPSEEDILQPMTNWQCTVKQQRIDSSVFDSEEEQEAVIEEESKENLAFRQDGDRAKGGEASGYTEAYATSVQEYLFESFNNEEEQVDADYVLNALNESREAVNKMDRHYSDEIIPEDEFSVAAAEFVRDLLEAKIVYRTFNIPVGKADLPPGQAFSIRGYFIPSIGPGYQFITHNPIRQHWRVCPDIHSLRPIIPPIVLLSKDFSRSYANKLEVLQAGDLSVCPYINAPCINVLVQNISMYVRPDEEQDDEHNDDPYESN